MALSNPNEITLVLVGRTGNGKSATGNSILQRKALETKLASGSVTKTAKLEKGVLKDGRAVNVIDTPGLFDFSLGNESVSKEIANCVNLAKDGIHAVLFELSVRNRFTEEEGNAIQVLRGLFGHNITDYMIIVFTGGDALDKEDMTLKDYLDSNCPPPLQELRSLCKDRIVLFNNKTRKENKKTGQINEISFLVNKVIAENGGKPYTNELFLKLQEETMRQRKQKEEADFKALTTKEISRLNGQMKKKYDEQVDRVSGMIESKLNVTIRDLENKLAAEQLAHSKTKRDAESAQTRSDKEIHKLKEELERVHHRPPIILKCPSPPPPPRTKTCGRN
ncbi:PREDICTED: immune-associated nucleotide-binding protein 8-like [Nelumbo nucifera]|nr:PREDICTED: immune-associated nucleotide-binding protein 8-like [Nelumbo nucifera]